jgi:hypothetical protein
MPTDLRPLLILWTLTMLLLAAVWWRRRHERRHGACAGRLVHPYY